MGQKVSCAGHRRSRSTQNTTELQSLVANAAPEPEPRRFEVSQTADLEGYMRAALLEANGCAPGQIFRPSKHFPKPLLRKGVMNRIITFPGSFAPPHMGHKLLLTHAFFRSNLDNVVAAIISPNSTRSIRKKLRNEPDAMLLTRKERASLWDDPFLTPWSWVNPFPHQKSGNFENVLLRAVEADGYEIEFVLIVGGDHMNQAATENNTDSIEPTVVLSDGLRSIPRAPSGAPLPFVGYGEWQQSEESHARLFAKLERGELSALAMLHLLYPLEVDTVLQHSTHLRKKNTRALTVLQECLHVSGCPWFCMNLQEASLQMQFVPARNVAGNGTESDLSSTSIRAVIREVDHERRVLALTDLALNPQLLSDLVDAKKRKKASKNAKQAARRRGQTLT
jgi:hypothetical protein